MRKQTASLELKYATACQDLEAAAQRAKQAEARRAELLKLVEEVRLPQNLPVIGICYD